MAKTQPKNERVERERTPLTAENVDSMAADMQELARRLSDVAQTMRKNSIAQISTQGKSSWDDRSDKLRSTCHSVERALRAAMKNDTAKKKVAEVREKYGPSGEQ